MTRGLGIGLLASLLATLAARPASAAPPPAYVIAEYCNEFDVECTFAPIEYDKTVTLPIAFDWDTGWIPQGSDLQVRFYVKLPATTRVKLGGELETTWPAAMTLATPGDRNGLIEFDYGLEVGAKAKIDVDVLGINFSWTGDIPYVPQVNFHLQSAKSFDSWAFAPDEVTTSAFTKPLTLFQVNLLGLVGIPDQISEGGLALDVKGELAATYQTLSIEIEPVKSGEQPILSQDGTTEREFEGGPFVEYDVYPVGKVDYTGTLHLIPTFYVEVLGKDFSIPLYDFPFELDLGDQDFVFDPVRVHVPLPDLEPLPEVLDFGEVTVGDGKKLALEISNVGEAKARATGFVEQNEAQNFKLLTPQVFIDSMGSENVNIRFQPSGPGPIETELTFVTNDPDGRFHTVKLRGVGVGQGDPGYPGSGGDSNGVPNDSFSGDDGGCGCSVPGDERAPQAAGWMLVAALALAGLRRRAAAS